jgi:hypothetical protein
MKKILTICILAIVIPFSPSAQNALNATLTGHWGYGPCKAVDISGNYSLIGSGCMLLVIDVTTPAVPFKTAELLLPGIIEDIEIMGNMAYIADGEDGLHIIDISNPASPQEAGFYVTPGIADGVAFDGIYAYVIAEEAGMLIIKNDLLTGINDHSYKQDNVHLQNYPNPVNGSTTLSFIIETKTHVNLSLYDCLGNLLAEFLNKELPAGEYQIPFDGSRLSNGVYFYTLKYANQMKSGKMVIMK